MKMITEDYISFENAKLLKKKGFDEATISYYNTISEIPEKIKFFDSPISIYDSDGLIGCIQAPTLQMAMKWLREVYNLEIYPYHDMFQENNKWWYGIEKVTKGCSNCQYEEEPIYSTYEEACEDAIKYCLENLI